MKKYSLLLLAIICFIKTVSAQIGNIVIPDGHAETIEKMLLSEDGKYLYTANNQKIIMWDVKQHIQLYSFSLAVEWSVTDALSSFILSNDGNYVAATGSFGIKCFSTITGKSVFNTDGLHYSATFSADSKKIHYTGGTEDPQTRKYTNGIVSTDLSTLKTETLFFCTDGPNCNFYDFWVLKNQIVMLKHPTGWQIADLDKKEILFTAVVNTKTADIFGAPKKMVFFPIANTNLIAASHKNKEDYYPKLLFYDAYTGEVLFSKELSQEWRLMTSRDGASVLLDPGKESDIVELIDVKKSGQTIKKINRSKLAMLEGEDLQAGIIDADTRNFFYGTNGNAKGMDLKSLQNSSNFMGEMAEFPIMIMGNSEYNEQNEELRIVTDYSNYASIDVNRMAISRVIPLDSTVNYWGSYYSSTGDTIALDIYDKAGFYYGIGNSKKTAISQSPMASFPYESPKRPSLFFGKEGRFMYSIKTEHTDQGDAQTVYQTTLATNTNKKIAAFRYNLEIDIQQDLIVGYDKTETSFIVKCWQLSTGKQIFITTIPRTEDEIMLMTAKVIEGQSKIAILKKFALEVYEMTSGKLHSSGMTSNRSKENKFILNHTATMVAETYSDGRLLLLDTAYSTKHFIQAHEGSIYNAYFSTDDKLIYTIGDDNTIKTFRTDSGELLGTLYLSKDPKDYVFVDPTGRFDGSPAGMQKLYYLKDRKVITLDKVFEKFYTPSLYQRLVNGEVFDPIDILIKGTPTVKIAYAAATRNLEVEDDIPAYQNKTGFADIVVSATAEDDAIDEIRLFHNGKIVTLTTRNLIVEDDKGASQTKNYQLTLLPGNNNIRAIALNTQRTESEADEIVVNFNQAANNSPAVIKPVNTNGAIVSDISKNATLYLVVVGINAYQNPAMSLNYALADATAFKTEIEKDAQTVISSTKTYFVTDADASKDGILTAFNQVKQNAKAQDVFIFYYAGHGVIGKDKEFYLVPKDVSDLKNVQSELESKGIPAKLLQQYAVEIQAQKQLFILDACQSAGAFDEMLSASGDQQKSIAVVSRSTGTHWMAASGAQQYANEFSQLGHGAFTYVLLQALKGSAANNKMITVNGLKNYIQLEVPALMKKYSGTLQYPASYGFGNDFPVEVIR